MLDPVRERFVQEYVSHGNASEAFRAAKPKAKEWKPETVHKRASEMLLSGEVQGRLNEIQTKTARKHEITIDSLVLELEEARAVAITNPRSAGAAVSATMGKAKLLGLVVDKAEHSGPGGSPIVPVLNVTVGRNRSEPAS